MTRDALNRDDLITVLNAVAEKMVDSVDILTRADQMGDADHGTGMKRGFTAVRIALDGIAAGEAVGQVFTSVGTTLMTKVGGASGAIFGTFFRSLGKACGDSVELNPDILARGMRAGLTDVMTRGKSKPGDKTMIDALDPAVIACEVAAKEGVGIIDCLERVAAAAEEGKEATKKMVATIGKAKTLGERTIGHVDPGALSMSIIFHTFVEKARTL